MKVLNSIFNSSRNRIIFSDSPSWFFSKSEAAKNKLLILKNGSNLFGILVEEVSSIQKIQANKIYAVDSNFQLTAKEFLKGIYKKDENSESIFILSISGILESEQFQKYEER